MEQQGVWIRVAGKSDNIKARKPQVWRCYIGEDMTEIPLLNILISGTAIPKRNIIYGSNPDKDQHGVSAWTDYFGSCIVESGVLHINLQEPPAQNAQQ